MAKAATIMEGGDFMSDVPGKIIEKLRKEDAIYYCRSCRAYHINTGDGFSWRDVKKAMKKPGQKARKKK